MVIGSFYSEVGTELLRQIARCDSTGNDLYPGLLVKSDWTARDYCAARQLLKTHELDVDAAAVDWRQLHDFMAARKVFLLSLLAKPQLIGT